MTAIYASIMHMLEAVEQLLSSHSLPITEDCRIAEKLSNCVYITTTGQNMVNELTAMNSPEINGLLEDQYVLGLH